MLSDETQEAVERVLGVSAVSQVTLCHQFLAVLCDHPEACRVSVFRPL